MIERLMRGNGRLLCLCIASAVLAAGAPLAAADTNKDEFSKANQLLFMTDHFVGLQTPARLEYTFERTGSPENDFTDEVELKVAEGDEHGKKVETSFLTGDRHRYTPNVDAATGNPVIMMFLQNDVSSIAERSGGSWRYLQRRVKTALENSAQVTEEQAEYDGQKIAVERIRLKPFAGEEEHRGQLDDQVQKLYVFTLSDAVPGGVLEMRSEMPSPTENGGPLVERLSLASVSHDENRGQKDDDSAQ
ncbi:hypothetical protein [Salinisphaera orenii]|uniref:Uncharacterized protein n=1 Tax=Salinisphaera orenii YIM 95161 TaxID=1051139 RepID=A0A423PMD9_9GAMM|nr:hypothetical protein [Salinisphaera halophila]ROO26748.1 hypothetical protein SAHL_12595 [Salinisphaera halophila YIM 95161]